MKQQLLIFTVFLSVLMFTSSALTAPGDVDEIRQAIAAQGANWVASETPYVNLSPEEKRAMLGLLPGYADEEFYRQLPGFTRPVDEIDEEVDWRDHLGGNYVTPVKNQGQCGSCWAFGGVGAMESNILIYGNTPGYPLDLSEQFLVSCSQGSCNGWYAEATLGFLQTDGTVDEPCLPYQASDAIPCSNRCIDWFYRNQKLEEWGTCYDVQQMKAALNVAPITGAFMVYDDFYAYSGGVYQHVWGDVSGGHMIAIVGYSDSLNAWICKNSWGSTWGVDGYFMIRMGYDECGIESWAPLWMVPTEAEFPNLTVAGSEIEELTGDGDGVLNPGETSRLFINLQNAPLAAQASEISAQIATTDPRVTILDGEAFYPDLQGGQIASNGDDFSISVAANCALGPISFTMFVYANESQTIPYYGEYEVEIPLSIFQAGYPISGTETDASPAVCDLNGDGDLDVISADFSGLVKAVDGSGNMLPGFPYQASGIIKTSPAIGDLDGDDDLEIVVADWAGHLIILNSNGSEAIPPITLPLFVSATPALGDLDGDGDLEIVLGCWNGGLYVYHHDGSLVSGFPFFAGMNQAIQDGVLLLDTDGDDLPEIFFGSYNHVFYAVNGSGQEIWNVDLGSFPAAAPSAADLGDGVPTIIIPDQSGVVHYLSVSGEEMRNVALGSGCKSSPSFADLNRDGFLDIAVNDLSGKIHVLNSQGSELPGFPVQTGSSIWASSSFADLNNDGCLELIVACNSGMLHARTHTGGSLAGFPTSLCSGSRSTASLINLDQDGDLEITLGTFCGLDAVDYKATAGPSDCWNTFRGNLRRTGNYGDGFFSVAVEPQPNSEMPLSFALLPAHPNPFNPSVTLGFTLPVSSRVTLDVFDLLGRRVATLADGWQPSGTHSLNWSVAQENPVSSGIYLVVFNAYGNNGINFNSAQKILLLK